ncbi:MAG: B12-binding domain-containing radical SAM protein [Actinomycetota bacterium]|nr:B12-binding domain-containing radical SAM protein [Actinomycetota bacterium]
MRLVLVDNLLLEAGQDLSTLDLQPHLGLISLVSVARAAGHEGVVYDPKLNLFRGSLRLDAGLYQAMAGQIAALSPDVVGFTALGCNFICVMKVARYLKAQLPDIPVLVGGPHVTILHRQVARLPEFDVVVRGEAELTLAPLLGALENGGLEDVPGITFRAGRDLVATPDAGVITDLDVLPAAAYDSYPIEELGLGHLRVEAGRGCPFRCTFCSTASFFGRRYRLKSPARLIAELNALANRYGIRVFTLNHDMFTANKRKVRDFCGAVTGRGYTWSCSARMDCVDGVLLAQMHEAGCRKIYFGVETGSARLQKLVQKDLDLALVGPTIDACSQIGIIPTVSFITGYPQETSEDQAATLDMLGGCLAQRCEGLNVQLHLLTPEPGTRMLAEFEPALRYDGHISDFNFRTLEPDDDDIMRSHPSIFVNHHYYESVTPRSRHIFVTEAFALLGRLGRDVLTCILDRYGAPLGRLIDDLDGYAAEHGLATDGRLLIEFFTARFDARHPLTSVVRFASTLWELQERVSGSEREPAEATGDLADRVLVLNPRVAVLDGIHDCPALLEGLRRDGTIGGPDGESAGRLGRYALVLRPGQLPDLTVYSSTPAPTPSSACTSGPRPYPLSCTGWRRAA